MIEITSTFQQAIKIRIATCNDTIRIDPSQFSLHCTIPTQLLLGNEVMRLRAEKVMKEDKKIQMKNVKKLRNGQQQGDVIEIGSGCKSLFSIFEYQGKKDQHQLTLMYRTKQILNFNAVTKPKFVRNSKLQALLQGQDLQMSGVISMDQTGRLLLQNKKSDFPVLGVWAQHQKIHSIQTYQIISQFLHSISHKTKFHLINKQLNCIYFVHIRQSQMPQCYLVNWECPSTQNTFTTSYSLSSDQISLCLGKDSLQFTLRAPRKSSITNPENSSSTGFTFTSPKKELTNQQFVQELEKFHLVESPQFSSIKKQKQGVHNWEQECYYLRNKVMSQQKEINSLQCEVTRLRKQIIFMRQTVSSPSQKLVPTFKSPNSDLNSSTPQTRKLKKLSESDLYIDGMKSINSISTKQKKSLGQSSSGYKGIREYGDEHEEQPWENFELIEECEN